jgi:hypothetical protein
MLQGDALQIGILLKEHPACSMIIVRGIVEPFLLFKVILLTERRDRGESTSKYTPNGSI